MMLRPLIRGALYAALVAPAAFLARPAHAVLIGDPVGGSEGIVSFYIPLTSTASGGYDAGYGRSVDSCYYPWTCAGGSLDITLEFGPVAPGPAILYLLFEDLDLFGFNDPAGFTESLSVSDAGGVLGTVGSASSPHVSPLSTSTYQLLQFDVHVGSDPYVVDLRFESDFGYRSSGGKYVNTQERMLAALKPVRVAAPGTLSLLGASLLVAAGFRLGRRGRGRRA